MTERCISFEQLGKSRGKSSTRVKWIVDPDVSEIRIEHSQHQDQWSVAGSVDVTDVHFVDGVFTNNRWTIVRYEKDGESYQLAAEGPEQYEDEYFYELKHEKVAGGERKIIDETLIKDMPEIGELT